MDQNLQKWHSSLQNSQKGINYGIIKQGITLEKYLITVQRKYWQSVLKLRTENHKFPVETGRWNDIDYRDRKCNLCDNYDVGDNFHYLLSCPYFSEHRKRHIEKKYYNRPNILKFQELMATTNKARLQHLSIFINILMNKFSNV